MIDIRLLPRRLHILLSLYCHWLSLLHIFISPLIAFFADIFIAAIISFSPRHYYFQLFIAFAIADIIDFHIIAMPFIIFTFSLRHYHWSWQPHFRRFRHYAAISMLPLLPLLAYFRHYYAFRHAILLIRHFAIIIFAIFFTFDIFNITLFSLPFRYYYYWHIDIAIFFAIIFIAIIIFMPLAAIIARYWYILILAVSFRHYWYWLLLLDFYAFRTPLLLLFFFRHYAIFAITLSLMMLLPLLAIIVIATPLLSLHAIYHYFLPQPIVDAACHSFRWYWLAD